MAVNTKTEAYIDSLEHEVRRLEKQTNDLKEQLEDIKSIAKRLVFICFKRDISEKIKIENWTS